MTDRDDFQGGSFGGGWGGSVASLYGAPMPYRPKTASNQPIIPAQPPNSAGTVGADIKARIAWLENELRQHEAWRLELATLRRMLAAYESPNESNTTPESNG